MGGVLSSILRHHRHTNKYGGHVSPCGEWKCDIAGCDSSGYSKVDTMCAIYVM